MEFFEHLKKYLNNEDIKALEQSLEGSSKHALLLNTEKMNEETLLSLFPNVSLNTA